MEPINQGQYNQAADEIDLFDLIDDIKEKWYWLIGTGLISLIVAGLYVFMATPVYQVSVTFKPVAEADLLPVNQPLLLDALGLKATQDEWEALAQAVSRNMVVPGSSLEKDFRAKNFIVTPEQIFREFKNDILSSGYLSDYFQEILSSSDSQLISVVEHSAWYKNQNFSQFMQLFSVVEPGPKDKEDFVRLSVSADDPQVVTAVLNGYSAYLEKSYRGHVRKFVELRIKSQIDQMNFLVDTLRSQYQADKQRRLLELQEALAVAKRINQRVSVYESGSVALGFQPPLYMQGEKALIAEIELLNNRNSANEDAYIAGVAEMLWKINTAKEFSINWDEVSVVSTGQPASIPGSPVKPKKLLILALGAVAGGMAGIMFALLAAAQARRKQRKLVEKATS